MKTSILSFLLSTSVYASPLLVERQSCPQSGISAARAAEVQSAFQASGIVGDTVPEINPTTELTVRYGNINENLGNTFNVLRKLP